MQKLIVLTSLAAFISVADGSELRLLPASARLDGPKSSQRFLAEEREGKTWIADRTGEAIFSSDNPRVATVGADGTVRPVGNGSARIIATLGDQKAVATISVENLEMETSWSFRNHVEPVLTKLGCNSGACHGAAAGKNGLRLSLRAYAPETDYNVLTRQALGRRIVRTRPAESLLLLKPTGAIEHGGGPRFAIDSLEYRVISEWIAAGTPPPSDSDPKVVALRPYPDSLRLSTGKTQQIVVQAIFSDGRVEDVTQWAKFVGTDDSVAKVDDSGHVRIEGHGEASVAILYASQVQRITVTVPYPAAIDSRVFRDAPRHNPIDEKNLAKLESLRISPSVDTGDAPFLRRAYLDATGTLPTMEVTEQFLSDRDPEKRLKLIDRLLNSPEYVDYWAYKWSDLLLVSSQKLPAPAVWSFYRFVRKSVAENMPWDRFAREVVTAKGDTLTNGAANYFVLHRDPIDLTESTSMAFLGLSLTCARCHNHPMEKWTQDQYYGMASLFARVRLKDAGGAGEVIVMPAAEGEMHHPRTGALMAPQPLDAAPLPVESRADRRESFADWLARPDNPYFTRAVVNRVWRNFSFVTV